MLHELTVHRIELELQNEELRRVQVELETERARYFDLYDVAPVGYFTVSEKGLVLEANLTAATLLGEARRALAKQPISRFLVKEDQGIYYLHRKRLSETGDPQTCELRMVSKEGTAFWARLEMAAALGTDGARVHRIAVSDITKHRQAEEALWEARWRLESESRLDELAQRSGTVLWEVDTQGLFVYASHVSEAVFGYRPEELVGRLHFYDLFPKRGREARKVAAFALFESKESLPTLENLLEAKDGHQVWVSIHGTPLLSADGTLRGYRGATTDITERRRVEQALRESEARYRLLFDGANDAILVHDAEQRMLAANLVAAERLGYTLPELESMTISQVDTAEESKRAGERIARLVGQGSLTFETVHQRKDGSSIPTEVSARLITWEGRPAMLSICRDITERKQTEEERSALESQLRHSQKLESLGVLAGGIAHDFSNILTTVIGNAELALLQLPPSAPARENLLNIARASRRAATLAHQMLAYSGRGHFAMEAVDLNALVDDLLHLLESAISKKARLDLHLGEDLPLLWGDPSQLSQVIMNLVINASEALEGKDGVIRISTWAQECSAADLRGFSTKEELLSGLCLSLEVSDTGVGMTPETQERIFEPFFTTKFTGRGLGLSAVLGIVRGHKGALRVYSEPGKGTTFKIILPAGQAAIPASDEAGNFRTESWRGEGTVLLVDDEDDIRALGAHVLSSLGFTALTAADGREAVSTYAEHRDEITLVVLDLTMPYMDGKETLRELRLVDPDVRVLMASGYTEADISALFADKGPTGFLRKPYGLAELREKLRAALEGGESISGPREAPVC